MRSNKRRARDRRPRTVWNEHERIRFGRQLETASVRPPSTHRAVAEQDEQRDLPVDPSFMLDAEAWFTKERDHDSQQRSYLTCT